MESCTEKWVDPHFKPGQMPGFMVFPIHRFLVGLAGFGIEEIDCDTEAEAITEFNRRRGVRRADTLHEVEQVF